MPIAAAAAAANLPEQEFVLNQMMTMVSGMIQHTMEIILMVLDRCPEKKISDLLARVK